MTPKKNNRGGKRNPLLAPERASIYLRPRVGEREEWERAAKAAELTLSGWIRQTLNAAAARAKR